MTRAAALAALLAALAWIPGAHGGPAATPGVTSTTILLGGSGPLSGPEVAYAGVLVGARAYFDHVNSTGGVHGRRIEYRYLDDGYDPSRTVQNTRRLVQGDGVFAMVNVVGTEHNLAIRPFLNAAGVPNLFGGTGLRRIALERTRYPWTMGYLPSFFAEGRLYGRHVSRTRTRARIAVLHDATEYGRELLAGVRAGLGNRARVVSTRSTEATDVDVSSQVAQLRRSGANVLMVLTLPKQTIGAFVAGGRLGWLPAAYVSSVSVDPAVMKIVQATAGRRAGEGAITVNWMKDATQPALRNDAGVRLYRSVMRRHAPDRNPDEVVHLYGMAVAYSTVEALKAAGRSPTRRSFLQAAHRLDHQVPFMLKGIRITTSPRDAFPISKVSFYRYRQGYWRPFGRLVDAGR
jgi:branched-chain amino acid transport system substrate-binding protein